LDIASLHIDEVFFDLAIGDLSQTIGQLPMYNRNGKHWLLRLGKLRLYGLNEFIMAASTGLATPLSIEENRTGFSICFPYCVFTALKMRRGKLLRRSLCTDDLE
jgi:hypothetical protein